MEQLLNKIEQLKAEYEALLPMTPERQAKLDKKFRLEFNYNSNHIEGNTLTYYETELLLIFDDTKGGHVMREYEEMKAHDVAFQLVQQWAKDPRALSEMDIKHLNKILLVRPFWKDAITPDGQRTRRLISVGEYKTHPNSVRLSNGEIFEYASPIDTPIKMQELVAWFAEEEESRKEHPLRLAASLHYDFVCIHPFDDGNGRVSRLLMNYVLLRHSFPPVIIKSADKTNYLRALNFADAGDKDAFIHYIGEQLVWSLELSIKAAKGENIEEPDDLDKELVLLQKQLSVQGTLQEKYSPENVVAAFENGLIDLFQMVETKLQTIASSFFEVERKLMPHMRDNYTPLKIMQMEHDWDALKTWLQLEIGQNNKRIEKMDYIYNLKGLKSNVNAPVFQAYIPVTFNDYNYVILGTPYPYAQALTQSQIQAIVYPVVKDIVEKIKATNQIS